MGPVRRLVQVILLILVSCTAGRPQTAPPAGQATAPGMLELTGDDAKRAKELDKALEAAVKADRWDEATAKAEELVALRTKAQGPKHFETANAEWHLRALRRVAPMSKEDRVTYQSADTMNAQGVSLAAQGKYEAAQPLFEKALEIKRRLLGDDNFYTADSYNHVAYNLAAQGKYAAAQPLYEKALDIHRRLLSDDHPFTAANYNLLAVSLHSQGKYAAAQPLFEKALEIRRRLLTDDHPLTAESYNNLTRNLSLQGKHTQAQPLYEKALEIKRRLLSDDHTDTATTYGNLAGNLQSQGKYAQAQALHEKALEIRRRLLGDGYPLIADSYHNLAWNLHSQAKEAEAQPHFEKALEIRRRLLTDDHPLTVTSYNNLAWNLHFQGKDAAAQPLFEKVLEIRRRLLGDDHTETAQSYDNLAGDLREQGKYAAAQPLYVKAMEIYRRLLTDDHPLTARSYNTVAYNLNAQGNYAQAQPLYEKALEIRRRLLTDDHPDTAQSYNNVAYNLNAQGNYAQAQPLYEKALEIRRRLLTDDHPDTAQSYNNVAYNLEAQGNYAQAQPLYQKALEIRRRFSDDHPLTAAGYNNMAGNLEAQGNYAQAQPLYQKALEIWRRRLGDDHPNTALAYINLADNLRSQGQYAAAQPLFEKALEIRRRLGDDHLLTAQSYNYLAGNLNAEGRYLEARDRWLSAVKGLDAARLRIAFSGLGRAGAKQSARLALAAVQARLGEPVAAWQALEDDLGRGLLDELAARRDGRLSPGERGHLRELTTTLERLERLVETTPKDLGQAERAKRFEALKRQRELASIALGELQSRLVQDYGPPAGQVAVLETIQAALPADAALVAWVDLAPQGPSAFDPDGEHWGVVVRSRGVPAWVPIAGTSPNGLWIKDDAGLAARIRTELRSRPRTGMADLRPLIEKLRTQRLDPLGKALGATADGLPPARRIIALPSRALAGIPIEALLAADDIRSVSYAPSATVFKYLRDQPRPDRHAGLLALGDPVYERPDSSSEPKAPPDHGLLVNVVARGSNAAAHDLKPGDVLLAYNGRALNKKEDLKIIAEGDKPIVIDIWRDGRYSRRELAPGPLGVMLDVRPAREAVAANRAIDKVLVASRSGGVDFAPLPGTRHEVEVLVRLFQSDDRPSRILIGADASEPELDRLAASGDLGRFAFIHLATHGVIDEAVPARSAVILTQIGLPDPLEQALENLPVFDGRLLVREIQHDWELKAELVTLSACETALGRQAGGEGFVGFTQALLMSGTRSVVLSLWKVDDKATSLLMARFYQNLLGRRAGLAGPMPKAEALREAKAWLRGLTADEVGAELSALDRGGKHLLADGGAAPVGSPSAKPGAIRPYAHPYYWAAFILVGDPD